MLPAPEATGLAFEPRLGDNCGPMLRFARLIAVLVLTLQAAAALAQAATRFPQDYHGLWWNPAENGWGVSVFDQGNITLSSVLFVYGIDGNPTWYVAPNVSDCAVEFTPFLDVTCGGKIYQTNGPWFGAGPFNPASVTVRDVGDWSGDFVGPFGGGTPSRGLSLTVNIDGTSFKRSGLVPQDISGSAAANYSQVDSKYTDLWWNPDESGWGVGVFHYKTTVFAVLFVYSATHQPTWYVLSLNESTQAGDKSQRSFEGPVFMTHGSWWLTSPFKLSDVHTVGNARLVFPSEGVNASLSYTIDGNTVQTVIRRESSARP
jgi:hypothetical protein